ncbi:MAG TPA: hypothetical protein PK263_00645 [bacterium]|nr:hypothetical protein [bacterium]
MDLATVSKRISELERVSEEIRILKEMLKGELENEDAYLQSVEAVKEAVKQRKTIKDEILAKGPNQEAMANIKNLSEEAVTLREILSAELTELFRENNADEIADADGQTRKFVVSAKVLPKKGPKEYRNNMGQYDKGE